MLIYFGFNESDYVVRYNSLLLSQGMISQVDKIIHKNFNITRLNNNIAILHVKEPIVFTLNKTKTICLPKIDDDPVENTMLTVTGWEV